MELIELRFSGLDKNIKKNISIRANEDVEEISENERIKIMKIKKMFLLYIYKYPNYIKLRILIIIFYSEI